MMKAIGGPRGRWPFWLGLAIHLGATLWSATVLPDRVALHFGAGGGATRMGSLGGWIAVQLVLAGVLALTFGFLPRLFAGAPSDLLNIPRKDHWLLAEHRPELVRRATRWNDAFALGLWLLLAVLVVAAVRAHDLETVRLDPVASWGALALFLGWTAAWCWGFHRSLTRDLPPPERG